MKDISNKHRFDNPFYDNHVELLSNVVYGALGSVPHFLNTIDEFYSTDYLS